MKRIFKVYEKRIVTLHSDVMNKKNAVPHFRWNRKVGSSGETITFPQSVKTAFEPHYNTENYKLEEISIGECLGTGLEGKKSYIVAWDNGDYILEISSDLSKSETINLDKSAKVLGN